MQNFSQSAVSLDGLLNGVATAIAIGCSDRQAATHSRAYHEAHLVSPERLTEESSVRFLSVIGDLPNKVRLAVACKMTWEHDVVVDVMELSTKEYPGPSMRSPFQQPIETLSTDLLAYAAPHVFAFLEKAGLQPHLKYAYNGDIRRYSLQIAIRVTAP